MKAVRSKGTTPVLRTSRLPSSRRASSRNRPQGARGWAKRPNRCGRYSHDVGSRVGPGDHAFCRLALDGAGGGSQGERKGQGYEQEQGHAGRSRSQFAASDRAGPAVAPAATGPLPPPWASPASDPLGQASGSQRPGAEQTTNGGFPALSAPAIPAPTVIERRRAEASTAPCAGRDLTRPDTAAADDFFHSRPKNRRSRPTPAITRHGSAIVIHQPCWPSPPGKATTSTDST